MFRRIRNWAIDAEPDIKETSPPEGPVITYTTKWEEPDFRWTDRGDYLRMNLLDSIHEFGGDPNSQNLPDASLGYLLYLDSYLRNQFIETERKWIRDNLAPEEIERIAALLQRYGIGFQKGTPLASHPRSYTSIAGYREIDEHLRHRLIDRAKEVGSTSEFAYHVARSEKKWHPGTFKDTQTREDFKRLRDLAADEIQLRGKVLPASMGEDLLVNIVITPWGEYDQEFFKYKQDYSKLEEWRQVKKACHEHWRLETLLDNHYRQRSEIGIEASIPFCRGQIEVAHETKLAFTRDQELAHDFRSERQRAWLANRGRTEDQGWMPTFKKHRLPEHRGFKQLAIIYDKLKDYESAIGVCREALVIDWPGDWDVRIARYERRLANQQKRGIGPNNDIN